jgi:hypothetical protein
VDDAIELEDPTIRRKRPGYSLYRPPVQVKIGAPTSRGGIAELRVPALLVVGWVAIAAAVSGSRSRAISRAR